jgi:hypothetical protein
MTDHPNFGWILVVLGLIIGGVGLIWILAPSIPWLGRLPGDIRIERPQRPVLFPANDLPCFECASHAHPVDRWIVPTLINIGSGDGDRGAHDLAADFSPAGNRFCLVSWQCYCGPSQRRDDRG